VKIPFTKAHGAKNDFLLTWAHQAPREDLEAVARAICDRHTGVGADGWLLVKQASAGAPGCDASIRLFNADGSEAEISGNGTRCAAAFLIDSGLAKEEVRLQTGAGVKHLRLIEHQELKFLFEMNMGQPACAHGAHRTIRNSDERGMRVYWMAGGMGEWEARVTWQAGTGYEISTRSSLRLPGGSHGVATLSSWKQRTTQGIRRIGQWP